MGGSLLFIVIQTLKSNFARTRHRLNLVRSSYKEQVNGYI